MPVRRKLLVVVPLLLALLGCKLLDRLKGNSDSKPPEVPNPPAALALAAGEPGARVKTAMTALSDKNQRLSAWLGVYEAAGVPVRRVDGTALGKAPAELPGPYFWQVWLASGLDKKGAGIPLVDAARVLQIGLATQVDYPTVAKALLEDLRALPKSESQELRFVGELVRERIRSGPSHKDIFDPATDTSVVIDFPTLSLLAWVVERATLAHLMAVHGITGSVEPTPAPKPITPALEFEWIRSAHAADSGFKCSELLGDKDATGIVKGILKLAGGGAKLQLEDTGKKVGFSKTSEQLAKAFGASEDGTKFAGKAVGWANAVTSLLSFVLQVNALQMEIDSTPDKIIRTKDGAPGSRQNHRIRVVFDTKDLPDGNSLRSCLTSFALNALGISLKLPENGKALGKVGIEFTAGTGFDRVMFADYKQIKARTDDSGYAELGVIGRGQPKRIPDTAKEFDAEYSFVTKAQSEAEDLGSIANMFWGSLKAVANPSGAGVVAPVLGVAKVLHYDLGEQSFTVVDWKPAGWKLVGAKDEATFDGQVCDIGKPFAAKILGSAQGYINYTPSSGYPTSGGTYSYVGSWGSGTIYGNGTYTFTGDPWSSLKLVQTGNGCVTHPRGTNCTDGKEILTLTVIESCTPTAGH